MFIHGFNVRCDYSRVQICAYLSYSWVLFISFKYGGNREIIYSRSYTSEFYIYIFLALLRRKFLFSSNPAFNFPGNAKNVLALKYERKPRVTFAFNQLWYLIIKKIRMLTISKQDELKY